MSVPPKPLEPASKGSKPSAKPLAGPWTKPPAAATRRWPALGEGAIKASALALALALGFGLGVNGFSAHAPEPQIDPQVVETQQALKKLSSENDALRGSVASLRAQVQSLQAQQAQQAQQAAASRTRAAEPPQGAAAKLDDAKKTVAVAVAPADGEASSAPAPAATPRAPGSPYYAYVYRYEKNGAFQFGTGAGHYDNVTAARNEALAGCQSHGGANCKFNYAPLGNCIAVARAPKGPLRVSTLQPDDRSAAAAALQQCEADQPSAPCQVVKTLCPKPE